MQCLANKLDAFRQEALPTEQEIMASWDHQGHEPLVTVLCHTFNQEPFIEDTLKGILIQKTRFSFELVVHDDASTDGTTEIVKEYASRYPQIVKPVVQTENQYSQGRMPLLCSFPFAKGEFIALCEGDDYWIDALKIEDQVEFLLRNPGRNFVGMLCYMERPHKRKPGDIFPLTVTQDAVLNISRRDVFKMIHYVHTSTYLFRRPVFEYRERHFSQSVQSGDLLLLVCATILDGSLSVINRIASVYREHRKGAWSSRSAKSRHKQYARAWREIYLATRQFELRQCQRISRQNMDFFSALSGQFEMRGAGFSKRLRFLVRVLIAGSFRVERRVRLAMSLLANRYRVAKARF